MSSYTDTAAAATLSPFANDGILGGRELESDAELYDLYPDYRQQMERHAWRTHTTMREKAELDPFNLAFFRAVWLGYTDPPEKIDTFRQGLNSDPYCGNLSIFVKPKRPSFCDCLNPGGVRRLNRCAAGTQTWIGLACAKCTGCADWWEYQRAYRWQLALRFHDRPESMCMIWEGLADADEAATVALKQARRSSGPRIVINRRNPQTHRHELIIFYVNHSDVNVRKAELAAERDGHVLSVGVGRFDATVIAKTIAGLGMERTQEGEEQRRRSVHFVDIPELQDGPDEYESVTLQVENGAVDSSTNLEKECQCGFCVITRGVDDPEERAERNAAAWLAGIQLTLDDWFAAKRGDEAIENIAERVGYQGPISLLKDALTADKGAGNWRDAWGIVLDCIVI